MELITIVVGALFDHSQGLIYPKKYSRVLFNLSYVIYGPTRIIEFENYR
jgi:hypothetical protein